MKVDVTIGDQEFIVNFDDSTCKVVVIERVVIFEGKRRKFYDEKVRCVRDPSLPPPPIQNPLYERAIELARSEL